MAAVDGPPRTALELAIAERNAVALGATISQLMDEAGRVVAEEILARVPDAKSRLVIVAGAGNNGGDGSSAAHYLVRNGRAPELWLPLGASAIRSLAARRAFERVANAVPVIARIPSAADLAGAAVVIDALLGVGQAGSLRGTYLESTEAINRSGAPVLSVDVPTGMGGPVAVRPRWTVTLSAPKVGLDSATGGEVNVRGIGIPDDAFDRTGPGDFLSYPKLGARGRSTRVAVVGGGPFAGAPALAALGALRAGAERATVYCPAPAADAVRAFSPDLVVVPHGAGKLVPDDVPGLLEKLRATRVDAVVFGMGLGRDPETVAAARALIAGLAGERPMVVDADALGGVAKSSYDPTKPPLVVTPNEGEFVREFGGAADEPFETRKSSALALASSRGLVVVRKGREDVIASGDRVAASWPHPPAANVGGSGDVLAGVLGRLLGAGLGAVPAARLTVQWLDGAAHRAAARLGDGLLATDLVAELPAALLDGLRDAPIG